MFFCGILPWPPFRVAKSCLHASSSCDSNVLGDGKLGSAGLTSSDVQFEADVILEDKEEMWFPINNNRDESSMWPIARNVAK